MLTLIHVYTLQLTEQQHYCIWMHTHFRELFRGPFVFVEKKCNNSREAHKIFCFHNTSPSSPSWGKAQKASILDYSEAKYISNRFQDKLLFLLSSPPFFLPMGKVMLAVSRSAWPWRGSERERETESEEKCKQFPSITFTSNALERSNQ